jgi:uncharacterized repeat protein (TIGR03803 family)
MRLKILLVVLLFCPSLVAHGQRRFRVLHAFGSGTDGAGVWDSVTLDTQGDVYGTTSGGGVYKGGTVFRLTPGSNGRWKETILHNFGWQNDGAGPLGGVIFDLKGDLYGTTETGGGGYTYGTVYKLSSGPGGWRETVLHRFGRTDQAGSPWGNLVMDERRNLYGTAYAAFELSPGPKGWTETILHEFTGKNGDGAGPQAGPIRDAAGNLYGTTFYGGGGPLCTDGCGTVWELSPPGSGTKSWTERILHAFGFSRDDGVGPSLGQLAMDAEGNLYGAANGGGKYGPGVVFKLTRVPSNSGSGEVWMETILYNFTGGADGNGPGGGVILDSAGNLYGTTIAGGSGCGCGVVYRLSPTASGTWKYTLLHTFQGSDGAQPDANLTLGPDGKVYGTAATGGTNGGGVAFELTP